MEDEPRRTPDGDSQTDLIADAIYRAPAKKGSIKFAFGPPQEEQRAMSLAEVARLYDRQSSEHGAGPLAPLSPLEKGVDEALDKSEGVSRIGFSVDPDLAGYSSIWEHKPRGIPEWMLKRVARTDEQVGGVVRTRANQVKSFGTPRPDRHSLGFSLEPEEGVTDDMDDDKLADLDRRVERARDLLVTCGSEEGVDPEDRLCFTDFLDVITQNAMIVGRVAVERILDHGKEPHSFRPLDAACVFRATPSRTSGPTIRRQAIRLLARLQRKNVGELADELDLKAWLNDEYSHVMVISGQPRQVFKPSQIVTKNFYPVPDIEMQGHPFTPIDSVAASVTTSINLTTYSKVYFQSGRAAKGALIFQSEEADQEVLKDLQIHMQSNINSANNAWRMPVISVGLNDKVTWQPIDQQGSRDAEFQYLADQIARKIFSAFCISPEEVTGWAYLSKGTNTQTLNEGANEYRLEAHRDLGLRPLLRQIEELVNEELLPIVCHEDPELLKLIRFRMIGLDAEGPDKELQHAAEAAPLHMTYNQLLEKFEKEPLPAELGGDVPLNAAFHSLALDKYVTVGWIREKLLGIKGASTDPRFDYVNNPLFFQQAELIQAQQQAAEQKTMQQQQAAAQQQAQQTNTGAGQGPGAERQAQSGVGDQDRRANDLQRSLDDAAKSLSKTEAGLIDLSKAEKHLPPGMRRVLKRHRRLVADSMEAFRADAKAARDSILSTADELLGGKGE